MKRCVRVWCGIGVMSCWVLGYVWMQISTAHADTKAHKTLPLALLFGHNRAGGRSKPLRYAEDDVKKMRAVLLQTAGFRPDSIWSLRSPTAQQVRQALKRLARKIRRLRKKWGKDGYIVLMVYYSGHAREGSLLLGKTTLPFSEVQAFLRKVPVDIRLSIVDACESGPQSSARGLRRRKASFPIPRLQVAPTVRGEVLISATGAQESAHEDPELRGGVFTHYLVSGLRGAADRDRDGKVTLEEIYRYTYTRSLARTVLSAYGPQRAHFRKRLSGYGQLVLSQLKRPQAWLLLRKDLKGDFFVWDKKRRVLFAELNKRQGTQATLALIPGRYVLHWRRSEGVFKAPLTLQKGQRLLLRRQGQRLAYWRKGTPRGGRPTGDWEVLEPLPPPLWLSVHLAAGFSALGRPMAGQGLDLELALPWSAWGLESISLSFQLGYRFAFAPSEQQLAYAFHRLPIDLALRFALGSLEPWHLSLRVGGRISPVFQQVSAQGRGDDSLIFSAMWGGVAELQSRHLLREGWWLSWGLTASVEAAEIGGRWTPLWTLSGRFGVAFRL